MSAGILPFSVGFMVSQPCASAVLRRPQKNTTPDLGRMYLVDFVNFSDFRAPKPCASVLQLPTVLSNRPKKHALEAWSMYLVDLINFHRF